MRTGQAYTESMVISTKKTNQKTEPGQPEEDIVKFIDSLWGFGMVGDAGLEPATPSL